MTKFAMTGGNGRLGKYLQLEGVIPLEGDVTSIFDVEKAVQTVLPDFIIHLATISDIDYCEDPKNQDKVVSTNLIGTANVLKIAEKYNNIPVVMLSSDHVFSGKRWFLPYSERSKPNPVNFYGHSKMSAEALQKAFDFKVVRTSYLFDEQRLSKVGSAPDFMYRSFMYIPHFVKSFMYYMYNYEYMPSIVHIAGSKTVSWKKLMRSINPSHPFHSNDDPSLAPRPYKAGLRTIYNFFPKFSYLDGIREMTK